MITGTSWRMASSGAMPNGSLTAGHDVQVGHAEDLVHVVAAQEAGEQDVVPDAQLGGQLDDLRGSCRRCRP